VDELNAGRPQCPVGLNTLVIPRKLTLSMSEDTVNEKQQPYVYLNCGHVQGHHDWGQDKDSKDRRCPMCLEVLHLSSVSQILVLAYCVKASGVVFDNNINQSLLNTLSNFRRACQSYSVKNVIFPRLFSTVET
jgi:pellino protein